MYFFEVFYNVATRFFTSFTHVFHKKRKSQEVQKSTNPICLDKDDNYNEYDDYNLGYFIFSKACR